MLESTTRERFQNCSNCDSDRERCETCDGLLRNIWVLIQHPSQHTLAKPTDPPVSAFQTGFLGWSIEQLQYFVKTTFGENGLGSGADGHLGYIADDAFAVIDERTAKDNTILFLSQEYTDSVQKAEVHVAWKKGSARDEALIRYTNGEESEEDIVLLTKSSDEQHTDNQGIEGRRARLESWMGQDKNEPSARWFEFRLNIRTAIQDTYGIYERGAFDSLLNPAADFDESGVMVG